MFCLHIIKLIFKVGMFRNEEKTCSLKTMTEIKKAYLEIILGPMFSGKTTELIEIHKTFISSGYKVAVINHSADTRYHETMLSTHDKEMIPCIQTSSIDSIWNYCDLESAYDDLAAQHMKLRWADVVLINEAQFFDDLVPCVLDMLKENKKVYVYGLDGDFQRRKFGSILELIPYSDATRKKTSFCHYCANGTAGIFTMRLTGEMQQTLVGSDNYAPVCRGCYEKRVTSNS